MSSAFHVSSLRSCVLAGAALHIADLVLAATIQVRADGSGDYPTIQTAIDASNDGDEIVLADGTYTGDGNRDISYGGRAITVRSESGDPNTCVIDAQASLEDLHHVFIFQNAEPRDARLFDVTIRGGYNSRGGGIRCENGASPTIDGCVFRENSGFPGGGLYVGHTSDAIRDKAAPIVRSCVFVNNVGGSDAALTWGGGKGSVVDTEFIENDARGLGHWSGSLQVLRCEFRENARNGLVSVRDAPFLAEDCLILDNTWSGAAGVDVSANALAVLVRCRISGNVSTSKSSEGTVSLSSGSRIENCTITGNVAPHIGGIDTFPGAKPTISSCIVAFNEGSEIDAPNATIECTNAYDHPGRDGADILTPETALAFTGGLGNFSEDPLFCDLENGDVSLDGSSPCLPGNHPDGIDCGLVGAFGKGCNPVPTERVTWGALKGRFR